MNTETLKELDNIRVSIENECISYAEIAYLQDHQKEIMNLQDVILAQWAGIDEQEFFSYIGA